MTFTPHIRVAALAAAVVLSAAACGSSSKSASTQSPTTAAPAATTAAPAATTATTAAPATTSASSGSTPAAGGVSVELIDTKYGKVLGSGGMVLYTFAPDNHGNPTCTGDCAGAWPPLKASEAVSPGTGLDAEDFATVTSSDGVTQLTFYKWPVYFFSGDINKGDVNGQGVAGKWFVVGADGNQITTK